MLRSSVYLKSPSRKPIISGRQHDARRNLERLEQPFKLRRVVELDMLARDKLVVDRRREYSPTFGALFIQSRKSREAKFVKHLTHVEKIFRARIEFGCDRKLVDVRARHEPKSRCEVLADVPPVDSEVPQIIRIPRAKPVRSVFARDPFVRAFETECIDAEVLIPA